MATMTPHKKIEILVDEALLRRIRDFVARHGATGYTVVPTLGGEVEQGRWWDDQVTGGAGSKVILAAVVDAGTADGLIDALAPLIDSHGLQVTVTSVDVVTGGQ